MSAPTSYPSVRDIITGSPLPALDGDEAVAEELVLIIHRGVDWNIWGGPRAVRYWDALADRVRAATYAGPTLSEWWQRAANEMASQPRNDQDRLLLGTHLATPRQRQVLDALHKHAATLVLRTRVHIETSRNQGEQP